MITRVLVLRSALALSALVALVFMVRTLYTPGTHSPISDPDDFRAFYCGGRALLHGDDPYLLGPMRTCEHEAARAFQLFMPPNMVLPAPFPPYALAFFALFALLPFPLASGLWFALALVAMLATIVGVRRLTGLPLAALAGAFVVADGLGAINEGQLAPLVTCALVFAALALRAGRETPAAALAVAGLVEPHVALPAVGALATLRRSLALRIALFGCVALAVDVLAGGIGRNLEYVTRVLPLHAQTETDQLHLQFGLPTVLWALGVPSGFARSLGVLVSASALVWGIVVGRRLANVRRDPAFAVLVPPVFVLLGSTFIHITQMVVALPAACLCFARLPRLRALAAAAALGLALPVQTLAEMAGYPFPRQHLAGAPVAEPVASDVAERGMMAFIGSNRVVRPHGVQLALAVLPKLPTWFALVALIVVCVRNLRARPSDEPGAPS